MGRGYPQHPLVGVGGLLLADSKVLLIKRDQPPGLGMWSLPGGLLELGEKLEQALVREMREETGLMVQPLKPLSVLEMILPDSSNKIEYHYILFNYQCRLIGGDLCAGSDAASAAWFGLDELDYRVWSDTAELARKVLQERS